MMHFIFDFSYLYSSFFVFVFFFKQKTAYERRIRDWSSDVCSSDLHRGDELLALGVLADARQVALLVQAGVTQELREAVAVEAAGGILEVGILQQVPAHLLLRHQHAQPRRHLVEHGARDHALEHLLGNAEGARLVHRELHAEPAAHVVDLVGELAGELALLDDRAADLRHRLRLAAAAKDVADAPDSEAEDQHAEEDGREEIHEELAGFHGNGTASLGFTGAAARVRSPGGGTPGSSPRGRERGSVERRPGPGNKQFRPFAACGTTSRPLHWP